MNCYLLKKLRAYSYILLKKKTVQLKFYGPTPQS